MTRPLTSPATHADAPGHSGFAVRGTTFTTRAELAAARIHVPTQRPIALLRQSGQKRVAGGVQVTSLVAYGGVWSGVADGVSQLELSVVVAHVDRDSREVCCCPDACNIQTISMLLSATELQRSPLMREPEYMPL